MFNTDDLNWQSQVSLRRKAPCSSAKCWAAPTASRTKPGAYIPPSFQKRPARSHRTWVRPQGPAADGSTVVLPARQSSRDVAGNADADRLRPLPCDPPGRVHRFALSVGILLRGDRQIRPPVVVSGVGTEPDDSALLRDPFHRESSRSLSVADARHLTPVVRNPQSWR